MLVCRGVQIAIKTYSRRVAATKTLLWVCEVTNPTRGHLDKVTVSSRARLESV